MISRDMPTAQPKPVVAVTGASRGIGHAIVRRFYARGWEVITLARTPFSTVCPWAEGIVRHIEVNLSDLDSVRAAAAALQGQLDARGLSALVNNAGISPKGPGGSRLGTIETALDDWKTVFQVNFFAPIMLARGLIAELERAKGAVVNVSSIAGSRVHPFAGAAYATSKSALAAVEKAGGNVKILAPAKEPATEERRPNKYKQPLMMR